jgi:hypothetical protein
MQRENNTGKAYTEAEGQAQAKGDKEAERVGKSRADVL